MIEIKSCTSEKDNKIKISKKRDRIKNIVKESKLLEKKLSVEQDFVTENFNKKPLSRK